MQPVRRRIRAGTFAVIRAFVSPDNPKWASYSPSTRTNWGRALELAERPEILGAIPARELRPSHVQAFLDGLAHLPGKQRDARTALVALSKWAIVRDLIAMPICHGTELVDHEDDGHTPWSEEQMALAEQHAKPVLSRAVSLAGHLGQRGSDLIRMCPTDLEAFKGKLGIHVRQQKTGVVLWIPISSPLQSIMDAWERRPGPFLHHPDGRPFTRQQLSDHWRHERRNNPALAPLDAEELVLHGLRGTAAVRLRRRGATESQISAMLGMSIPTVRIYCRLSDQRENAMAAVELLSDRKTLKLKDA
jgi:integrase